MDSPLLEFLRTDKVKIFQEQFWKGSSTVDVWEQILEVKLDSGSPT